jgi:RNA polymerase sigma factor (sigma-70 family)
MLLYGSSSRSSERRFEQSFEEIFKRHYKPLLSYCRHMLGDQDEAEDALQQAFIKAHRALQAGSPPRELRPWLYAIARNCCLSAIVARRATAQLQDHTPALAGLSEEVRRREDLRELLTGIGRLPEDQRSALLLAELDDLSHQEIATVVGCPVSKVKGLIYQARSALIADRDARNTPCQEIREQLAVARGGELRRGPLRRHLKLCAGCHEFQLAVNAQRQSLAAVLPVAPSAGLAAAILGHGAAHTAAATSITGSSAGIGAGGMGTGAGAGLAGAGGGTSVGALVGGGALTKLAAVGGAVVAMATAGVVAVHARPPTASHPAAGLQAAADLRSIASSGTTTALVQGSPAAALALATTPGQAGSATGPGAFTELSGLGGANPLLSPTGGLTASGTSSSRGASRPATGTPGGAGHGASMSARAGRLRKARLRREQLRRARLRRQRLRRARLRRERLRRAVRRHRRPRAARHRVSKSLREAAQPQQAKPPVAPPPTPAAPVRTGRVHHRARPTPVPGTESQYPLTTSRIAGQEGQAEEQSKATTGRKRRHPAVSKASESRTAGAATHTRRTAGHPLKRKPFLQEKSEVGEQLPNL